MEGPQKDGFFFQKKKGDGTAVFFLFMAMFVWYLMLNLMLKNLGCNMVTFFGGWYGTLVVKTLFFLRESYL